MTGAPACDQPAAAGGSRQVMRPNGRRDGIVSVRRQDPIRLAGGACRVGLKGSNGRPDIWSSVPDALASAAAQLVDKGWQRGRRWGFEVRIARGFDCSTAEPAVTMKVGEWLRQAGQ